MRTLRMLGKGRMRIRRALIGIVPLLIVLAVAAGAQAQDPSDIVQWSARLRSGQHVRPGEKVVAVLAAQIKDGWHIYSITQPPKGPKATVISVPPKQIVRMDGQVKGPKPETLLDPNLLIPIEIYEHSASLDVPLLVNSSAKAGRAKVVIDVLFEVCNERFCLPPTTVHVPLTVTTVAVAGR